MSVELATFLSAISGAIIGGLITGYFAIKSTQNSFDHQMKQSDASEENLIKGVLQAIHDEIETVNDQYQDTMGARLDSLPDGEALAFYYPLVSDFFAVYNGNCFLIGRIPNNDLRKQIIKTYTLAKGMVDSFRLNNELVGKFEHSHNIYEETQEEIHRKHAVAHHESLVEYAKVLKASHKILKSEISNLLRALRKNGVLNEVSS